MGRVHISFITSLLRRLSRFIVVSHYMIFMSEETILRLLRNQDDMLDKLNQHSVVLDEHAVKLDKHSVILDKHSVILDKHSVILDKHSVILDQHSKKFDEQSNTLEEHSVILGNLMTKMTEHDVRMDEFLTRTEFNAFKDVALGKLDTIVSMIETLDQERHATNYRLDCVEEDVRVLKEEGCLVHIMKTPHKEGFIFLLSLYLYLFSLRAACAAASLAMGTRKGEQET